MEAVVAKVIIAIITVLVTQALTGSPCGVL
jgi:hypothetical protein